MKGPRDTHPAAHELQAALYRRMTPEERGEHAIDMSEGMREIARSGIRLRHPEYTEAEVARALVHVMFGKQIARSVWPRS